jgi:putative SOS response-associated peptidase YedK
VTEHYVHFKNDHPFGIAGLWERWENGDKPIESCTILTTDANDLMKPIHERMQVIIPPDKYDAWLDPQCQDAKKLEGLLRPFSGEMVANPVSTVVNNPRNEFAKCIEPEESLF